MNERSLTVMVIGIEDRFGLIPKLHQLGYDTMLADNAFMALSIIDDGARPDIIISATAMSPMGGLAIKSRLEARPYFSGRSRLPAIILAAVDSNWGRANDAELAAASDALVPHLESLAPAALDAMLKAVRKDPHSAGKLPRGISKFSCTKAD